MRAAILALLLLAPAARADVRWYEGALLGVSYGAILADYSSSLPTADPKSKYLEVGFPNRQLFGLHPTKGQAAGEAIAETGLATGLFVALPDGWRCLVPLLLIATHGRAAVHNLSAGTGFNF